MTNMRDWRSAADYADTVRLSASGWAWEFLRRNPEYRGEVGKPSPNPKDRASRGRRWGLFCCRGARPGGP